MPRPSAAPSPSRWRLPDAGRKCVRLSTRERRIKSDSRLGNLIERKISTGILPKIELWSVPVQIGRKGDHSGRPCPLWVKSGHRSMSASCPLYPRKRTFIERVGMSALCQKRTHALQQSGAEVMPYHRLVTGRAFGK